MCDVLVGPDYKRRNVISVKMTWLYTDTERDKLIGVTLVVVFFVAHIHFHIYI